MAYSLAQAEWDSKNTVQIHLKFNKSTDADILRRLMDSTNRQGYIKRLIRDDIASENLRLRR